VVEGIRFHMHGAWRIEVTIETAEDDDTIVISLDL
jgi:hypothetical protein